MTDKCKRCLYHTERDDLCNYILITGHRRGCSVENCDKFVENACGRAVTDHYAGASSLSATDRMLLDLYESGLSDRQIGELSGFSRHIIRHWRNKMGLPSRKEIEVDVRA